MEYNSPFYTFHIHSFMMATHVAQTRRCHQNRYNKVVHGRVIILSLRILHAQWGCHTLQLWMLALNYTGSALGASVDNKQNCSLHPSCQCKAYTLSHIFFPSHLPWRQQLQCTASAHDMTTVFTW